jgi:hypothetical protein
MVGLPGFCRHFGLSAADWHGVAATAALNL